jgi:DNA-directed RNA polymerase subunit M/transcription elongation factor TFIIS
MQAAKRQRAYNLLCGSNVSMSVARDVESLCHAASVSQDEYDNHVIRAAYNLARKPELGTSVVYSSDATCAVGTPVGLVQEEARLRRERFHQMLQEKYDALNDVKFKAIVRCRKCGSDEITWEEKQVRSADEGATIFAACSKCKNRWVLS